MGNGQIALDVGMLLAVLGFIVTVMTFVWRMATLAAKIQRNEDKHDKMESSLKRAHDRLDEYSKKHDSSLEEMRQQISSISEAMARIEEKVTFLANRENGIRYEPGDKCRA